MNGSASCKVEPIHSLIGHIYSEYLLVKIKKYTQHTAAEMNKTHHYNDLLLRCRSSNPNTSPLPLPLRKTLHVSAPISHILFKIKSCVQPENASPHQTLNYSQHLGNVFIIRLPVVVVKKTTCFAVTKENPSRLPFQSVFLSSHLH